MLTDTLELNSILTETTGAKCTEFSKLFLNLQQLLGLGSSYFWTCLCPHLHFGQLERACTKICLLAVQHPQAASNSIDSDTNCRQPAACQGTACCNCSPVMDSKVECK